MAPAAPPPPAVFLHDAVALSGRFPLLAGVDLEVATGETVLVEGPNGAGKTSLLRVCAGLVPLASGQATVLGLDPVAPTRPGAAAGRAALPRLPSLRRPDRRGRTCASRFGPPAPTPIGSTAPAIGWD